MSLTHQVLLFTVTYYYVHLHLALMTRVAQHMSSIIPWLMLFHFAFDHNSLILARVRQKVVRLETTSLSFLLLRNCHIHVFG